MTRGAQTIHEDLILEEGFDPTSDEYYSEIDKRMRREFPHKFQEKRTSNAQVVTPCIHRQICEKWASKEIGAINTGQVAFATKMRIPLEKYAEEVIKIENRKQAGNNMSERNPRESKNRDNSERVTEWKPPSTLEAPEPPVGYKHRWIRESVMEYDDRNNIHKKRREGYELVKAEEYPDFDAPVIDEGKNSGVIGVGGLVLARIPEEIAEQRNKHYSNVAKIKWKLQIGIG